MERIYKGLFLVTCFMSLIASDAFACPTCKDLVGRGVDAFKMMKFGEGIAWSMIPLFGVPVLLVGALVFIIIRSTKKNGQSSDVI